MSLHSTPAPLSEHDLDAIELRALAATREPWQVQHQPGYPQRISTPRAELVAELVHGGHGPTGDAEFIASARTDVPALIGEVRRLRRTADRSRATGVRRWAIVLAATTFAVIALSVKVFTFGGWVGLGGGLLCLVAVFCLGWLVGVSGVTP